MINEFPPPPVSPSPHQEPPIRAFTVHICEDCLALKGEMCHTPECRFCRRTMREVGAYLDALLIRPIVDGQRLVADEGDLLSALPVGSPDRPQNEPEPLKPFKQYHNKKFSGEGFGSAGPYRVVVRTDRKTDQKFIEIIHDDDAGGVSFTKRQATALIPCLQNALGSLAAVGQPALPDRKKNETI